MHGYTYILCTHGLNICYVYPGEFSSVVGYIASFYRRPSHLVPSRPEPIQIDC